MSMSLLLRTSSAVENEVAKKISIVKRAIGSTPNRTLRIQIQERKQLASIWRYRHVGCTNANRSMSSHCCRNEIKQQQHHILKSPASVMSRTDVFNINNSKQSFLHGTHRLSTTNTNNNNQKEKENKDTKDDENTIQMPDKDTELQLADLQATITEEYKRGNFTQALSSSKDLLKQTQQHFGYSVDHPATASAMNNVGLMHKLLGNFNEARQHYVGAMRIYASVCGRDHASYAMTLHNLGNLNKSQVHFDASLKATERLSLVEAAMEYLEEAYAIRVAELGAEHPHTIATRSAIGSTLAAQVLYQHKMVEDTNTNNKSSGGDESAASNNNNNTRKRYVALNPEGVTQQQWRAAEEHLRVSLKTAIENPRGRQVQNNNPNRKNHKKGKKKGNNKQYVKQQQRNSDNTNVGPSSGIVVTTLSAASAAQNLAVFLKSLGMTFDDDSPLRKQHMYEAKDLYEKVQQVRAQLLPHDHPDLYATKYSLAELLAVLASSPSSYGGGDNKNDEEEQERQHHQDAANALRQEIIDTYDPPDLQQEEQDLTDSEKKSGPVDVVVEKTERSKK
jgi:hypothetical protein